MSQGVTVPVKSLVQEVQEEACVTVQPSEPKRDKSVDNKQSTPRYDRTPHTNITLYNTTISDHLPCTLKPLLLLLLLGIN